MTSLSVRALRALSRPPAQADYMTGHYEAKHQDVAATQAELARLFPGERFSGRVLDVGCAEGLESVALARLGATDVVGIDIRIHPGEARALASSLAPQSRFEFYQMAVERLEFPAGAFDAILTLGSLEHFADPYRALEELARVLAPQGRVYLTSGVWRGPWGAHMNAFTMVPWVQYLFPESAIMEVRRAYRADGARRYHEVEGGLNQVGTGEFRGYLRRLGLVAERFETHGMFGSRWVGRIPWLGEFFTHQFLAVLRHR